MDTTAAGAGFTGVPAVVVADAGAPTAVFLMASLFFNCRTIPPLNTVKSFEPSMIGMLTLRVRDERPCAKMVHLLKGLFRLCCKSTATWDGQLRGIKAEKIPLIPNALPHCFCNRLQLV